MLLSVFYVLGWLFEGYSFILSLASMLYRTISSIGVRMHFFQVGISTIPFRAVEPLK